MTDGALLERQRLWKDPGGPGRKPFPVTIQGTSTAAKETGFDLVEWGVGLDCGLHTRKQRRAVLLTHTHPDHVQGLARTCLNSRETFNVFCPPSAETPLQRHLEAYAGLRGNTTKIRYNSRLFTGKLLPLAPAEGYVPLCVVQERSITAKRDGSTAAAAADGPAPAAAADGGRPAKRRKKGEPRRPPKPEPAVGKLHPGTPAKHARLMVRTVPLKHTVDTVGYLIAEKRHRLTKAWAERKAEVDVEADLVEAAAKDKGKEDRALAAKTAEQIRKTFQDEIIAERKAKRSVQEEVIVPMLAFLCDGTSESILAAVDNVCAEPAGRPHVVMLECTFIDDADAQQALSRRHVLWSKIKGVAGKYADVQFLLIHFSHRYHEEGVLAAFAASLPANVHAFL